MKKINLSVICFVVLLFFTVGIYLFLPLTKFIHPPYNWLGIIFVLLGLILNLYADSILKPKGKNVTPKGLLTKGPFKISRNPMYLGMLIILLGVFTFFSSLTSIVGPIVFFLIVQKFIIPKEEKELETTYGEKYLDYKNTTRRWL
jgi:protein-S-isoprenylcysteine O-methyltransferase Ste14